MIQEGRPLIEGRAGAVMVTDTDSADAEALISAGEMVIVVGATGPGGVGSSPPPPLLQAKATTDIAAMLRIIKNFFITASIFVLEPGGRVSPLRIKELLHQMYDRNLGDCTVFTLNNEEAAPVIETIELVNRSLIERELKDALRASLRGRRCA